eukprot:Colp12_sorted_trinity150504_noHs@29812
MAARSEEGLEAALHHDQLLLQVPQTGARLRDEVGRGAVHEAGALQPRLHALDGFAQLFRLLAEPQTLLLHVHQARLRQVHLYAVLHYQVHARTSRRHLGSVFAQHIAAAGQDQQLRVVQSAQQHQHAALRLHERVDRGALEPHDARDLPASVHVILRARIADAVHQGLQGPEVFHGLWVQRQSGLGFGTRGVCLVTGLRLHLGPVCEHNALPVVRDQLPQRLRQVRHERVQQAHAGVPHVHQHATALLLLHLELAQHRGGSVGARAAHARLAGLHVPVGELVPQEVVHLAARLAEVVALQRAGHPGGHLVTAAHDEALGHSQASELLCAQGTPMY